jgi:hypothetical protein
MVSEAWIIYGVRRKAMEAHRTPGRWRETIRPNIREASWSAPALWRFPRGQMPDPNIKPSVSACSTTDYLPLFLPDRSARRRKIRRAEIHPAFWAKLLEDAIQTNTPKSFDKSSITPSLSPVVHYVIEHSFFRVRVFEFGSPNSPSDQPQSATP